MAVIKNVYSFDITTNRLRKIKTAPQWIRNFI